MFSVWSAEREKTHCVGVSLLHASVPRGFSLGSLSEIKYRCFLDLFLFPYVSSQHDVLYFVIVVIKSNR